MSLKRKLAVLGAAAGLAPLFLVLLPAASAGAHGYISSPPSRQAQCAQGTVACAPQRRRPGRYWTATFSPFFMYFSNQLLRYN